MALSPLPLTGGRRHGVTVKALKSVLKKNGMKTTGKKATLTRRVKKARLMGGQLTAAVEEAAKTAKGVVDVGEALVKAPIKGVKAALNSSKGGRR